MSDVAIQNSRVAIAQLREQPHQAPVLWLRARALNSAKGLDSCCSEGVVEGK
jgi:hypothetical protein